MRVAGLRLRPWSLGYVLFEDTLILAVGLAFFPWPLALALLVAVKAAFFWAGLYDFRHLRSAAALLGSLGLGLALAAAAALALCLFGGQPPRTAALLVAAAAPAVLLGRACYEAVSRRPRFRQRLLFLGVGAQARRTARELLDFRKRDYELVGFLAEREEDLSWRIGGKDVLGTFADLERVAEEERIKKVVVAVEDRRKNLPLEPLLRLRLRGVEVLEEARVHEEIAGKIPVEDLRPSWLIFSDGFDQSPLRNATKRAFDLVAAAAGLMLAAPIAAAVALAIRLEGGGPALFRQRRVGRGGREFTLYKFRTMRTDAEAHGPQWARKDDARVTKVGRFLRRTRLDEIPQLWNVLEGTMSFVGPRPERPHFVEELRKKIPFYDQRHVLKPGVTGWAQVRFRYGSDESDAVEKLRHDMFYVKHHSILLDLRILLETVRVVLEADKGR